MPDEPKNEIARVVRNSYPIDPPKPAIADLVAKFMEYDEKKIVEAFINCATVSFEQFRIGTALMYVAQVKNIDLGKHMKAFPGFKSLAMCVHGQLEIRAAVMLAGKPRTLGMVACLPGHVQRKLIDAEGVEITTLENGEPKTVFRPLVDLTYQEARRVFIGDHIATAEEQLAKLHIGNSSATNIKGLPPWIDIDKKRKIVTFKGEDRIVGIKVLADILAYFAGAA